MKERTQPGLSAKEQQLETVVAVNRWQRQGKEYWKLVSRLGHFPPGNGQLPQQSSEEFSLPLPGAIKVAPAVLISAFLLSCPRPAEVRLADAVVEVDAIAGTITDFVVHKGDKLTLEASGTWCMGPGECGGPDGIRKPNLDETDVIIGGPKLGTLLGLIRKIDGSGEIDFNSAPLSIFPIGSKGLHIVEADGKLVLGMNDRRRAYGDNSGSVEVKIYREQTGSGPQVKETPRPVQPTPTEKSKSPDSQTTQPVSIIVEATNKSGTTTGIRVRRGDTLTFQASGAWCMGIGECGGPDGIRPAKSSESDVVLSQAKIGALLGRIGSKMFSIGSKGSVTVETDGQLELLMNDRACCYGDNTGRIEVGILGGQFTSIEKGPQRELTVQNPIKILPTKVEIKDSNEEGWKIVIVELGFENTGRNPVPVGLDSYQQFIKAMILTKEGFGYGIYGTARGVFGDIQSGEILPPGFRAKGKFWHGPLLEDRILDSRMAFKVARNTSGYKLQIPGFPDIDLEKEVERTKNLKFPTDRPDSDFKEFGGSFTIPGKGTVHFLSIEKGQIDDDKAIVIFGPKPKKDAIVLRARFDNANQGYDQSFSVSAKIIADDGIIYPAGLSTNIGPGLSKEAITSFPPHINGGKLVVTGDGISEIFNLRIQ